ncbi:hypothetical protein SFUMM280S_04375 [Streptomyces fumanus]
MCSTRARIGVRQSRTSWAAPCSTVSRTLAAHYGVAGLPFQELGQEQGLVEELLEAQGPFAQREGLGLSACTAWASSALEPKWKYRAPLVTPERLRISVISTPVPDFRACIPLEHGYR